MKSNWSDIIKSAALGNVLHLVLAFLYTFGESDNGFLTNTIMGLIFVMWIFVGFRFAINLEQKSESKLLILSLVSVLPMILFLIACQGLEGMQTLNDMQNYSLFYFIGLPVLFWNRPFMPIMSLFKDSSIYIQLDINTAVVFLMIFLGGYLGFYVKKYLSHKKENNSNKV